MSTNKIHRSTLGIAAMLAGVLALSACSAPPPREQPAPLAAAGRDNDAPGNPGVPAKDAPTRDFPNGITEGASTQMDVSPPLRDMKPIPPGQAKDKDKEEKEKEKNENPSVPIRGHKDEDDPVIQDSFAPNQAPGAAPAPAAAVVGTGFQGINFSNSSCNCAPPDTNGDVGLNHYVQTVNSAFAVYSKAGALLYGPAAINTVWQGFGGACQVNNDGDPVLLYDSLADRWVISQFTASSPYNECIAISQTGDPTGAWYRYAFQLSTTNFPDYPKLGVWPDGYYMSVNQFNNGATYAGPRPYVFNRAAMLNGQPATYQTTSNALGSTVSPILPADLDGTNLPVTGAPGLFVEFGGTLDLYKFAVNWSNAGATTWTKYASLTPAGFNQLCTNSRSCVPQAGTSQKLDGLGDRLMNRLVYRNQGTYESLLLSHAVSTGPKRTAVAGVRWYELRAPFGTPSIYQQGTYAPADGNYRWMSSVAMDKNGNIGLGYSVSGNTTYPSIRVTGRLSTDALGQMTQGETTLLAGTGYQSGVNRWGDYANLSIDPVDNCTFWFTTEYNNSGGWSWGTSINSFKLPGCQ